MLIYTGYERKPFRAVVEEEGERERERERREEGRGRKKGEGKKTEKRKGEKRRLSRCINANISHRFA